ncbi:MAG: hypothetical protein K0S77_2642, partial [Pseudomonas sp.]|nr:hypothetical protein [Pseudomonas sp.]
RDELRQLKEERDQLQARVARLSLMLEQARSDDKSISH